MTMAPVFCSMPNTCACFHRRRSPWPFAGSAQLQTGKNVNLTDVQPVGNYAVKLVFDDGHDSGLYSWDYLYQAGANSRPTGRTIWHACHRRRQP